MLAGGRRQTAERSAIILIESSTGICLSVHPALSIYKKMNKRCSGRARKSQK